MMIDLKAKIEQIIESEYEQHKINILDADYLYKDQFIYHQDDILADFQEYIKRELNQFEIDKIYDYLFLWNYEENIQYQSTGTVYSNYPGEFAIIGNMGELEIDLSYWFNDKPLKQSVIDAINKYTNLYVSDSDLAYYDLSYDVITVKNDNDTLTDALLYPLHDIGEFTPFEIKWYLQNK